MNSHKKFAFETYYIEWDDRKRKNDNMGNEYPIILIWKVYKFEKIQITMKYNFVWTDTNLAWYIYQNSIWTAKLDSKYDIIDEEEDDVVFIRFF